MHAFKQQEEFQPLCYFVLPIYIPNLTQPTLNLNRNKQQNQDKQKIEKIPPKKLPLVPIVLKQFPTSQTNQIQSKTQKNQNLIPLKYQKTKINSKKNNQNRNILPNSLHQIMSYVLKQNKSGLYAEKMFSLFKSNSQWTVRRYYIYQQALKDKINYYLKETSLKLLTAIHDPQSEIYSIEEQHFYMKISRLLAMHYIKSQSITLFLTSRRMSNSKKLEHFKNRRDLILKAKAIFQSI